MLKITVIQIGKTRQEFLRAGESEYLKRLHSFAKVEIITLKDFSALQNPEVVKQKEAEEITKNLPQNSYCIFLDSEGKKMKSEQLAEKIEKLKNQTSHLVFVIGGTYGLSETIKKSADFLLSFSDFTFTHEMIRMLLLEQVYRAFCISNNKTYHY